MDGEKHQLDLFISSVNDPYLRDVMDVMAYGFLSLSKRRLKPIIYQTRNVSVMVTANATYGMATIWDWEVVIALVSMINNSQNDGLWTSRRVGFRPYDLLHVLGRAKGGANYRELAAAIRRLRHTGITTNIRLDDQYGEERPFSFIEDYRIPERYSEMPNMAHGVRGPDACQEWEVTLAPWVYKVVERQSGILAIDKVLFSLKGGIEKFLYRYARKAVPKSKGTWKVSMLKLYELSGSCGSFHDFQKKVRQIEKRKILPEYRIEIIGVRRASFVHFHFGHTEDISKCEAIQNGEDSFNPSFDLDDHIPF